MSDTTCIVHQVDEPRDDAFRVCHDCRHVYQRPADIASAHHQFTARPLAKERLEHNELDLYYVIADGTVLLGDSADPDAAREVIDFCPYCGSEW